MGLKSAATSYAASIEATVPVAAGASLNSEESLSVQHWTMCAAGLDLMMPDAQDKQAASDVTMVLQRSCSFQDMSAFVAVIDCGDSDTAQNPFMDMSDQEIENMTDALI